MLKGVTTMKRERIPIPRPRSAFFLVQCTECGNETIIFSHTTSDIRCKTCGTLLAGKTGGKANIYGKIIRRVD